MPQLEDNMDDDRVKCEECNEEGIIPIPIGASMHWLCLKHAELVKAQLADEIDRAEYFSLKNFHSRYAQEEA